MSGRYAEHPAASNTCANVAGCAGTASSTELMKRERRHRCRSSFLGSSKRGFRHVSHAVRVDRQLPTGVAPTSWPAPPDRARRRPILPEIGNRRRTGAMRAAFGRESKLTRPHAPESSGRGMHDDRVKLANYSLRSPKAVENMTIGPISKKYRAPGRGRPGTSAETIHGGQDGGRRASWIEEGSAMHSDLVVPDDHKVVYATGRSRGLDARTPLDLAWT